MQERTSPAHEHRPEATGRADGCVEVSVNGAYYGVFDTITRKFFSGYPGDRTGK